ncbi:MAG: kelch motif-containing protein [Thermoproteota archaeon]|nr:kelch motif-containing protein [Thermoproteota archaeon]
MSSKRSGIAAASINNDIYVFGGEERSKTSNNNEEYDVIIIEGQLNLQCQHTDCKTAWLSNYYLSLFVVFICITFVFLFLYLQEDYFIIFFQSLINC